ncbi:MAG TPA: PAS domain-containing protein [Verrucomicrobiae bacterium]
MTAKTLDQPTNGVNQTPSRTMGRDDLGGLCDQLRRLVHADYLSYFISDIDRLVEITASGRTIVWRLAERLSFEAAMARDSILESRPVEYHDVNCQNVNEADNSIEVPTRNSYLASPVVNGTGETVGAILTGQTRPRTWSEADKDALRFGAYAIVQLTPDHVAQRVEPVDSIQLRRRIQLEHILTNLMRQCLREHQRSPRELVEPFLSQLGEATNADRVYLFELTKDSFHMSNTAEWCQPGVKPQIKNLQELPTDIFPWWMAQMHQGRHILLRTLDDLPPEADAERAILEPQKIKALAVVPICSSAGLKGFIGYDSISEHREWVAADLELLQLAAEMLGHYICAHEAHTDLLSLVQTERKAKEEREQRYQAVFNGTFQLMSLLDPSGLVLEANQPALDFIARKAEDELGKPFWETDWLADAPLESAKVRAGITRAAGGEMVREKLRIKNLEGILVDIDFSAKPLKGVNGSIQYLVVEGRDISQLVETEQMLQAAEQRWKFALDGSDKGVWDWDLPTNQFYLSPRFEQITGFENGEHPKTPDLLIDTIHPDDRQEAKLKLEKHLRGETCVYEAEHRVLRKDGTYLWIRDKGKVMQRNEQGHALRIVGTRADISHQIQILTALSENERRLRSAQRIAKLASWEWNIIEDCVTWSPELYEMAGRELSWTVPPPSKQRPLFTAQSWVRFQMAMTNLPGIGEQFSFEAEILRPDGGSCWVILRAECVEEDGGKVIRVAGTAQDITLTKTNERNLRERSEELALAIAQLEKAGRMKDEFLASMSHELRTPLTGILSLSEVLLEGVYGQLSERQSKYLKSIEESGRHLLELINDILDLAKIESGQLTLQLANYPISDLCSASTRLVKEMMAKKNQTLTFVQDPQDIIVRVDARRIKQMLVNLLSNAVKFTPNDGRVWLRIQGDAENEILRIEVEDSGIGISPSQLSKLFQPFVQLDSKLSRQYNGTGLGLALVRQLAELHGGCVGVTSEVGVGSKFFVEIPWKEPNAAKKASPKALPLSTPHALASKAATSAKKPLVLIADDNPVNVEAVKCYLEARGYDIRVAVNGEEAVTSVEKYYPDVVLMDIQMPKMDGLEATEIIRQHQDPAVNHVHIIALTALAMPGDKERCLRAGCDDYLSKPVKLKALSELIGKICAQSESRKA